MQLPFLVCGLKFMVDSDFFPNLYNKIIEKALDINLLRKVSLLASHLLTKLPHPGKSWIFFAVLECP